MLGDTLTRTCQGVSCIYPKNWPMSYYLLLNLVLIEGSLGTTVIDGNTPCKSSYLIGNMSVASILLSWFCSSTQRFLQIRGIEASISATKH